MIPGLKMKSEVMRCRVNFFPLHSSLSYSCESSAKRLISKMEGRSFESSLWQPLASAQRELHLVKLCQMCLLTSCRTSADSVRNPWVRSASRGLVFLCQTRRVIKSGLRVCASYRSAAVTAPDQDQQGTKNVLNGWQRW